MRTTTSLVILLAIGPAAYADDPAPAPDATPDAPAQPAVVEDEGLTMTAGSEASYVDGSGVAKEWMILPAGQVLGGELRFLTSKPSLGPEPIEFSDVALLTLHIKSSVYGKAEVAASVDVLPKQPSWTDEKVWQSA